MNDRYVDVKYSISQSNVPATAAPAPLPCRSPDTRSMQRDLVLRWLEQISALIAKLLRRDPTVDLTLVEDRLDDAETQLLGPLRLLLERLEPASAAELLTDPWRIQGYAELLAFRSAIARLKENPTEADDLLHRARVLGREALRRADPVPPEWPRWLERLESDAPPVD